MLRFLGSENDVFFVSVQFQECADDPTRKELRGGAPWGQMEAATATASDGTAGSMPSPDITVGKGSAKRSFPFQGDETLEFIPLGAGNEVGRSCCILKVR